MSHNRKLVESLPQWFVLMNNDARLSAKEVVALFGFSNTTSLYGLMAQGLFPLQDDKIRKGRRKNSIITWKKSTIIKEIERRRAASKAGALKR